jgi:trehalose 6-phosphate phosphatase
MYARPMSPKTAVGEMSLRALISDPRNALLAFDFDGVLSPIVDDPEQAQPLPGIFGAIADLSLRVGAVAIITGRPVSFVISRKGFQILDIVSELTIYGHYGLERWDAISRKISSQPTAGDIAAVRAELEQLLHQAHVPAGVWLEDKGSAVAVHTRRTADPDAALAVLSQPVQEVASRHQLRVEPGKMVLEIRPAGISKGDVLREIVAEHRFTGVLYAGDDLGDLSAFAAVDALRNTGVAGVKVCSASAEAREVAEAADLVVDGPAGIVELLAYLRREVESAAAAAGR